MAYRPGGSHSNTLPRLNPTPRLDPIARASYKQVHIEPLMVACRPRLSFTVCVAGSLIRLIVDVFPVLVRKHPVSRAWNAMFVLARRHARMER